jgi:ribosomal small subunit protein bTHX
MGKGDKKTKRGKIIMGSFGVRRPKKRKSGYTAEDKSAEVKTKTEVQPKAEKVKEKKKTATKKAVTEVKEETVVETPKKKTSRKSEEKETEAGGE